MDDIAATLTAWVAEGRRVAVATLVSVDGSAPRTVGASMAVDDTGRVVGSVSGGCVEGALVAECEDVLAGGGERCRTYGLGDWLEPGVLCGGTIQVRIRDLADVGVEEWHAVERAASGVDRPSLVLVGAGEVSVALCALAARAGFAVTVVDPRPVFATKERFPDAHAVVVAWPDHWCTDRAWSSDDALCVLGHDLERESVALAAALSGGAGYVGAMGSRSTHDRRVAGLVGVDVSRLHSPIGLDLGGSSPGAMAVSVLAEVMAVRFGGSGVSFSRTSGPLHPRAAD